jgi:hypothetical protein
MERRAGEKVILALEKTLKKQPYEGVKFCFEEKGQRIMAEGPEATLLELKETIESKFLASIAKKTGSWAQVHMGERDV